MTERSSAGVAGTSSPRVRAGRAVALVCGGAVVPGVAVWGGSLTIALLLLATVRQASRPAFMTTSALTAALFAWLMARRCLEHTEGSPLVEATVLGLVWLAVALAGDALVMVTGPQNEAFPFLVLDVMLAHLVVPVAAAAAAVTATAQTHA